LLFIRITNIESNLLPKLIQLMKKPLLLVTIIFVIGCNSNDKNDDSDIISNDITLGDTGLVISINDTISDYDMSTVDQENSQEFKENLIKIEQEFGDQWGFCDCVIKGDSINKAFANPNISDNKFKKLSDRFDIIDEKCRAFRIQNPNITPQERRSHEVKVKKCLRDAGIK